MSDVTLILVIALASALAVGGLGWLALRLRAMRSLRTTIAVATACSVLTVVAGMIGTARAMFLSAHDFGVVLLVCIPSAVVAILLGLLLAREVVDEARDVQEAARAMAEGEPPSPPPLSTTELAAVSRELEETSKRWAESREREAALEAARHELVAWISHDLRSPLAGVRAMAEALEDDVAQDPARYHRQIRSEVDRLSAMVSDLLQLSRLHAGTRLTSREPVVIGDVLSDALASADAVAQTRGVTLSGAAPDGLVLYADPRDVARVLDNLVGNAIRHTRAGGSVEVQVRRIGSEVVISVQDECGGMADADLDRVFEVGWRGTHARTPAAGGGAGLGLAIVRGIVTAQHGSVGAVNVGTGCRFEVRLPLGAAATEQP